MNESDRNDRPACKGAIRQASQFTTDESGMVTLLALFMVIITLMVGGIGVDMMHHEMERTRLQAVSDRAVLAAADLDQTLDPEAVVRDYFDKAGMAEYVSSVTVDNGLNYRSVLVDATNTIGTQFMDMFGVETLTVPAIAKAEERINKVEISLVVDISGSMKNNGKMANLQNAASTFIDTVLTPENENLISLSLIPYSEHVNAGPAIFGQLNMQKDHDYSYCVEFPDDEFTSVQLDTARSYDQMQHFQWNYYSNESGSTTNTRYDTVCPRQSYEEIVALSQDPAFLKNRIAQFKPRAGTSIFLGLKWAAAMLDPSFRPITGTLSTQGHVDAVFDNRPAAYSDSDTLKTVILMTDGQNDKSYRIPSWYYDTESEIVHWNNNNLQHYLYHYVSSSYRSNFFSQRYDASFGDGLLEDICDAAKDAQIVIWSIGFEVTDHGADVMRDCASSPSHFFRVEGIEIADAFDSIARQINQLRLTQ